MTTIDRQLRLVRAAESTQALLMRPGRAPDEPAQTIVGESFGRPRILEGLEPILQEAWPGFPREVADLEAFLEEAGSRLRDAAARLEDQPGFVPAAGFTRVSRERTFEYVKLELEDVRGGIDTEEFWCAFDAIDATAPIKRLTRAGLLIKLRALGAFVVHGRTSRHDEMTADDFFPEGTWKQIRGTRVSEVVERELGFANKQVAHITLTRPLPEDIELYAGSQVPQFERVIRLFSEFDRAVDVRLLPDWWPGWFADFVEPWADLVATAEPG